VFAALDRAWPLVALALTLIAILSCMSLLSHLAIKYFEAIGRLGKPNGKAPSRDLHG
jgi:hypothetical protein